MAKSVRNRTAAAILVLASVAIVGLWLQPATAHIGSADHLWTKHIRPLADDRYLRNTKVYISTEFSLTNAANLTVDSACPAGWQAVGGGVDFVSGASADVRVTSNGPTVNGDNMVAATAGAANPAADGWRVKMHNNTASTYTGVVGAICAR